MNLSRSRLRLLAIGAAVPALAALILLAAMPFGGCEANYVPASRGVSAPPAFPWQSSRGAGDDARQRAAVPIIEGPFDEVWVIARSHPHSQPYGASSPAAAAVPSSYGGSYTPGTGALFVADEGWLAAGGPASASTYTPRVFPLERTTVRADLSGPIASVRVGQRFHNPFSEKIEAVYVFPLPHDAAVDDFVLTIGDRRVRGVIRDREQAQQIYQQARSAGYVASLLEQERANIFQERIANIEPGRSIEVTLHFVNTLAYEKDAWQWRFPMVVSPRFNPPYARDPISALPVGGVAASGGPGAVPGTPIEYLREGERSGADIDLEVRVDAGAKMRGLESPTHAIDVVERFESTATLRLAARDRIPNRDFVLRYSTGGSAPSHAFVTDGSSSDGTMLLSILPPVGARDISRVPLEVIFILDTSGSMSGRPFEQMKEAVTAALDRLRPEDRFQIVTFNNTAQAWGTTMARGDRDQVRDAKRWVSSLQPGGGTMMLQGLRAALALPHDAAAVRTLVFITDALLSNEDELLRELHFAAGRDRVFALGVGNSVNWALLDAMGRVGGGAVAALSLESRAAPCMEQFLDRMARPVIHSMQLTFEGGDVRDAVPSRLPDLAPGTPVTIAARYGSAPPSRAVLTGWIDNRPVRIAMDLARSQQSNEGVRSIWARQRIAELSREAAWSDAGSCREAIRQLALSHNLVSPFTSFVAVDASAVTSGTHGTTVIQPAHMPSGMRYDTTVGSPALGARDASDGVRR